MDATSSEIRDRWGAAVVAGGSHTGRGTRNELTGLGGATYLEIVGPDAAQPPPEGPRPFGVDQLTQPAFVAWCACPARPLTEVLARIGALGLDLGPVAEMSRMRPDGAQLNWRLTFPLLDQPHRGTVPFLIDWLDSPHPSTSLPHDAQLISVRITHPQSDVLVAVLAEIASGSSDLTTVEVADGPAELHAEISTRRGVLQL